MLSGFPSLFYPRIHSFALIYYFSSPFVIDFYPDFSTFGRHFRFGHWWFSKVNFFTTQLSRYMHVAEYTFSLLFLTAWYSTETIRYVLFLSSRRSLLTFEKTVSISVKTILLSHFLTPYNEKVELLSEKVWRSENSKYCRGMTNDRTERTIGKAEVTKTRAKIIDIFWAFRKHKVKSTYLVNFNIRKWWRQFLWNTWNGWQ